MKIRLRDIFLKYPMLDRFRRFSLVKVCKLGANFFTSTYRIKAFYPAETKPYLENIWEDLDENSPDPTVSKTENSKSAIFAIYHGRMSGLCGLWPHEKLTILISNSRDGEIIARACQEMGFSTARGSPAHGGVKGALEMVSAAKGNRNLAFMVDGPRGPKYEVKAGLIRLAEITGLPIIPFVSYGKQCYWMDSWDNFMAPWWGTPMLYLFGHPIDIPKGISENDGQKLSELLEARMKDLKNLAEKFYAEPMVENFKG
ncbi:MAG: DUF374 domain-containing protein [Leptolyngbya sp.]|nr:DUF374 domain-containing protein [Candidatus Melainabacteria bacterium]